MSALELDAWIKFLLPHPLVWYLLTNQLENKDNTYPHQASEKIK